MKRMLSIAGGTDRDTMMARRLARNSELTLQGARIVVDVLGKHNSNMERFVTLTRYLGADGARDFLQQFDYT